jgi:DNA-binding response OmpR family regulator/HPt (histidine-containing phosphotransfer) domain-containing protein
VEVMKILIVEDDRALAEVLRVTLSTQKYAVEIAYDGQAGLDFIEAFDYDLILLDAVLPKLDGISICRHVRSRGYMMPILLLTSMDSKHDRAIGLDAGADDYVIKPFDPEELSARIRALLRRGNDRVRPVLNWENLTLDPRNYEVTYQRQLLNLTPKEYSLLELFIRHSRQLFSCGAILEHLWAYEDAPSEEAVRTHIKGLRHKLKAAGAPTDFIETVYGIGYRLKPGASVVYQQLRLGGRLSGGGDVPVPPDPVFRDDAAPVSKTSVTSLSPAAGDASDLPNFLTNIWNRHREQLCERVACIDRAIVALQERALTPELRKQAWHSAHNLAGALGTFGLPHGSQVAKQLELLLADTTELTPAQIPQLQQGVAVLSQAIASRTTVGDEATGAAIDGSGDRVGARLPWLFIVTDDTDVVASLQAANPGSFELVSARELGSSQLAQIPAAIVLDLDCFPQAIDGLTALSELERDYPHLPVVVLSQPQDSADSDLAHLPANSPNRMRQRIEAARRGARLFLSKPMPAGQILAAIDRVIQQVRSGSGAKLARRVKVTIVDDDRLLLEGVSTLLSRQGMIVTTLAEPSRFWEVLEASVPDLLILDLDMPMYDGIELCQAVRTDPTWATLPILFLTAHAAAIASDRVFAAGADDFVTKPVVDTTLVTRIINRLDRIGFGRSIDPVADMSIT